jgi:hypothetical protein
MEWLVFILRANAAIKNMLGSSHSNFDFGNPHMLRIQKLLSSFGHCSAI